MARPANWGAVRIAARKVELSGVSFAQLQKAFAEVDAGQDIVGPQRQRVPIKIRSSGILSIEDQNLGHCSQGFVSVRRELADTLKRSLGARAIVAFQVQVTQCHPQIDMVRRGGKRGLQQLDRLLEAPLFRELAAELDKGRRKRRTPRQRSLQLRDCIVVPLCRAQCDCEQRFKLGILASPYRSLQHVDGLDGTVLRQQHTSQKPRGRDIAATGFQYLSGEALRLVEALHLQRKERLLENAIGGARRGGWRRQL